MNFIFQLLKLKSKISNDDRFKIDERFLDDNTGPENESTGKDSHINDRLNIRYNR